MYSIYQIYIDLKLPLGSIGRFWCPQDKSCEKNSKSHHAPKILQISARLSHHDPPSAQSPIQILAPASVAVMSGKQPAQPAAQPKIRASRYP